MNRSTSTRPDGDAAGALAGGELAGKLGIGQPEYFMADVEHDAVRELSCRGRDILKGDA